MDSLKRTEITKIIYPGPPTLRQATMSTNRVIIYDRGTFIYTRKKNRT